jgi:hypothetical protein
MLGTWRLADGPKEALRFSFGVCGVVGLRWAWTGAVMSNPLPQTKIALHPEYLWVTAGKVSQPCVEVAPRRSPTHSAPYVVSLR